MQLGDIADVDSSVHAENGHDRRRFRETTCHTDDHHIELACAAGVTQYRLGAQFRPVIDRPWRRGRLFGHPAGRVCAGRGPPVQRRRAGENQPRHPHLNTQAGQQTSRGHVHLPEPGVRRAPDVRGVQARGMHDGVSTAEDAFQNDPVLDRGHDIRRRGGTHVDTEDLVMNA